MNLSSAAQARPTVLAGILVVVLLFALPLFRGLDRTGLRNDEAIYSYAVDSMVEGNSWPTPESIPSSGRGGDPGRREARLFLEKPPLQFWIVAITMKLGLLPTDEFGMRFWAALFGSIAFVYVFLIGRRLVDWVGGIAAVALLFVNPQLLFSHGLRSNVMEAPLFLAYCGGIYHFLLYAAEDVPRSRRRLHIFALTGWFVLGFMTKFVAAVFLPAILGCTVLAIPEWRERVWKDRWLWFSGGSVAVLCIAPWFIYETLRPGSRLWEIILGRHVVQRMVESLDPEHLEPWYYYLQELHRDLDYANAFLLVLIGACIWIGETVRRRWKGGLLVLVWFLLPLALVSVGVSKLSHYFYPFLPPVALIGAYPVALLVRLLRGIPSGVGWIDAAAGTARDRARDLRSRIVRVQAVRVLFGVTAAISFGLALITLVNGPVRLEVLGVTLLSNSSVVRPLIIGTLALLSILTFRSAVLAGILALFFLVTPFQQYLAAIERTGQIDRPLRASRDCLLEEWKRWEGRTSRIFVHLPEHVGLTHNYYYYYRRFDRWRRPRLPDDRILTNRLLAAGQLAPTLILEDDYKAFLEMVDVAEPPAAIRVRGGGYTDTLIVMPGPFAACVDASVRAGAVRYEPESDGDNGGIEPGRTP